MQREFPIATFQEARILLAAVALAYVIFAPIVSAAAIASATVSDVVHSPEKCTFVEPPTNSTELIKNIQCAVAKNIFFDDDIFTNDEKLWKLVGGTVFYKDFPIVHHLPISTAPNLSYSSVGVDHFPESIDKWLSQTKPSWSDQMGIAIRRVNSPPVLYGRGTRITVSLGDARGLRLGWDDVIRLFGSKWSRVFEQKVSAAPVNPVHGKSASPLEKPASPEVIVKILPAYEISYTLPAPSLENAEAVIYFDNEGYIQTLSIILTRG
jgi:hypothetical protein